MLLPENIILKRTHYAWLLVALLWVVGILNYLDRQVIFSLFSLLRAELSISAVKFW